MSRPLGSRRRVGAAAVEMAVLAMPLLVLLFGIWEVGRIVQVQQVLSNSAREGGRLAAQGTIVNLTGAYTEIALTGSNPSVTDTVKNYLDQAGFDTTGLEVEFQNVTSPGLTEPYLAAKGDQLRVTVRLPYSNVAWVQASFLGIDPSYLVSSADFYAVRDQPFSIDENLPGWSGY